MVTNASGNRLTDKLNSRMSSRSKSRHRSGAKGKLKEDLQLDIEDLHFLKEKSKILVHKKRQTKDGRNCASVFAFNGQIHHDCTEGTSPDNKNTGEEWCYVDANAGGSPNWGYCKPIMDYDGVRRKTQKHYLKMVVEARKVNHLVMEQIMPTSKLNGMVSFVKARQQMVDFKLNMINNQVTKVSDNYNILLKIQTQFDGLEVEINELKKDLEEMMAKKEAEGGKNPANCDGMLGYENEAPGDGVKGLYYDNEDFMGEPQVDRSESNVDFQWDNEEPAPGINQDNFSIKWQTWLRVPISGKYNFYSESDDGNQVLLNGKPIITHFWSQTGKEGGNWLQSHIGNLRKNMKPGQVETNAQAGLITAQSYPISLEGGNKYKLEFNMYHSVHNEELDSGSSFAKLFWENEYMEKQIISQDFLYTENKQAPVKLFNYDPKLCEVVEMKENESGYLRNENYKWQDIPFEYQGAAGLKCVYDWPFDDFKFSVNGAIQLFVIASATENPLPDDFKFTQDVISVLKINPKDKPQNGRIKALTSEGYNIYKKKYQIGDHVIQLTPRKEGKNHLSFFYTLDPGGSSTLTCGGQEVSIASPENADFESCAESTRFNQNGWGCEAAFSGKMQDSETGAWATDNQGVGGWVSLQLKNAYQISRIEVKNRNSAIERNSKLELKFDGGETRKIQLKNLDSIQNFKVEPAVISKSVRIGIKQVYSTLNNGGSFNLYGTPCVDPRKLEEPDKEPEEPKELEASCDDTLLSNKFQSLGLAADQVLIITCAEGCVDKPGSVYGDLEYSEDSYICKAAYHAGAIDEKGGKLKMTLAAGKFEYKGAFRSGLQSKGKEGNSILTMVFETSGEPDVSLKFKVGDKIDIYDEDIEAWLPGVIDKLERKDAQTCHMVVKKENMPDDSQESLDWPDPEKLDYCGKKVEKRECGDSKPVDNSGFNVKIAFGIKGPPQGYLLDSGEKFSEQNGFKYGWSLDNSKNMRMRQEGEGLENQLVLFSPDAQSEFCTDPNSQFTCDDNAWSIKAPKGTYNVKLVMGDKKFQTQYDLAVNGIRFVSGKQLAKDQFLSETRKIKVAPASPSIKINTKCNAQDCQYSWSRLSAIEIEQLPDEPEEKKDEGTVAGCGEAQEGGKCGQTGQNLENCLYKHSDPMASYCTGQLKLVDVAQDYFCKDQRGKWKCIKSAFADPQECQKKCPGKCKAKECLCQPAPPTKKKSI